MDYSKNAVPESSQGIAGQDQKQPSMTKQSEG